MNEPVKWMNLRTAIIEFLIQHQPEFKDDLDELKHMRDIYIRSEPAIFRQDLQDQYDARIKQHIAFITAEALAVPTENVIIELEKIDLEDFLNV